MDRAAIGRVDDNDRGVREAAVIARRNRPDVRRYSPVLALLCREQGKKFREEIRPSVGGAEDRHDLCDTRDFSGTAVCAIRIRKEEFFDI